MSKLKTILKIVLIILVAFIFYLKSDEIKKTIDSFVNYKPHLSIRFLDVGQGDATFFEFKNGEQMLVDCSKDRRVMHKLGKVMPFYDRTLEYLMITHPDLDHYGGCVDLLKRLKVEYVFYNGFDKDDSKFFKAFQKQIEQENTKFYEIREQRTINIASSSIKFLFPDKDIDKNKKLMKDNKLDSNNSSLVFSLKYGKIKLLMTGDAEKPMERYLFQNYRDELDADIYKMGHHGSAGSSREFFVEEVDPDISVASAGKDNNFGHPSRRAIKRLERVGSSIYRTDKDGGVSIDVYLNKIKIKTENGKNNKITIE